MELLLCNEIFSLFTTYNGPLAARPSYLRVNRSIPMIRITVISITRVDNA